MRFSERRQLRRNHARLCCSRCVAQATSCLRGLRSVRFGGMEREDTSHTSLFSLASCWPLLVHVLSVHASLCAPLFAAVAFALASLCLFARRALFVCLVKRDSTPITVDPPPAETVAYARACHILPCRLQHRSLSQLFRGAKCISSLMRCSWRGFRFLSASCLDNQRSGAC